MKTGSRSPWTGPSRRCAGRQVYTGPSHGYRPSPAIEASGRCFVHAAEREHPGGEVLSRCGADRHPGGFASTGHPEEWRAFVRRTPTRSPLLEVHRSQTLLSREHPGRAQRQGGHRRRHRTGDVGSLRSEATYDSGDEPRRTSAARSTAPTTSTFRRTVRTARNPSRPSRSSAPPDGRSTTARSRSPTARRRRTTRRSQASEAVKAAHRLGRDGSRRRRFAARCPALPDQAHSRSTAALQALDPSALSASSSSTPTASWASTWVADDLIHRIAVRSDWESGEGSTIEFYDFGADITIRPPS